MEKYEIKDNLIKDNLIYNQNINLDIKNILNYNYKIEKIAPGEIKEYIFDILLEVANDGFGINMSLEDIKNHIYKSDEIFLLKIDGEIIGFSSVGNFKNFIYRFGTVMKKDFQGKGLYKILNNSIYNEDKKYFIRTQNKNVIKSLEKIFDNIFVGKEALEFLYSEGLYKKEINSLMLEKGDKKETLKNNGIFKGVYNGKMGDNSRVNYIDESFYKGFNPELGDSLLVVYFNNKK